MAGCPSEAAIASRFQLECQVCQAANSPVSGRAECAFASVLEMRGRRTAWGPLGETRPGGVSTLGVDRPGPAASLAWPLHVSSCSPQRR